MRVFFSILLMAAACSSSETRREASPEGGSENLRGVQVTVSGESIAREGFVFPPSARDAVYFVDGWELRLSHLYASFGAITVSGEPNKDPSDQSAIGPEVASLPGPFIADLVSGDVPGVGEGDWAWEVAKITQQQDGKPFASDQSYAFGFDMLPVQPGAVRIGVREPNDVEEMERKGYSVLYTGTAIFRGMACTPSGDIGTASEVHFRLGFRTHVRSINCLNPELGRFGEASPRGLAIRSNGLTRAQITFHVDHPFWSAIQEEAPLRFDAFAFIAGQLGKGTPEAPLELEDLKQVPFVQIARNNRTLRERTCPPADPPASLSDLSLDPKGRSVSDYYEFVSLLQASMVHLNGDGLCAVKPLP